MRNLHLHVYSNIAMDSFPFIRLSSRMNVFSQTCNGTKLDKKQHTRFTDFNPYVHNVKYLPNINTNTINQNFDPNTLLIWYKYRIDFDPNTLLIWYKYWIEVCNYVIFTVTIYHIRTSA